MPISRFLCSGTTTKNERHERLTRRNAGWGHPAYRISFQLQAQIKGGQSGEIGDRSFYLLFKSGQEYGRMNINLYAPYGHLDPGLSWLSYAINLSGSRVLR